MIKQTEQKIPVPTDPTDPTDPTKYEDQRTMRLINEIKKIGINEVHKELDLNTLKE